MAGQQVLLAIGILLQPVHTLKLEASWTVYLMSTLENTDLPAASHLLGEGISIGNTSSTHKLLLEESFAYV